MADAGGSLRHIEQLTCGGIADVALTGKRGEWQRGAQDGWRTEAAPHASAAPVAGAA